MNIGIIYLLGAAHGLILALVLARKRVNRRPNKLLALLMVVFSIDLAMAGFYSLKLEYSYPHLIGLDYSLTLLYGPLLFLYMKTLAGSSLNKKDVFHFIPFIVLLLYMIPFYAEPGGEKIQLVDDAGNTLNTYGFSVINHMKVIHGLTYVGVVAIRINRYQVQLRDSFSTIEKANLAWLKKFIIGVIIMAVTAGVMHLVSSFGAPVFVGLSPTIYDDVTLLSVMAFIYGIGYMGLYQPEVFGPVQQVELSERSVASKEVNTVSDSTGYQKSGLEQEEASQIKQRLIAEMRHQKLYRNSELTLNELAAALELSPHNVTETINQYIGKNFYDFVNEYRIEEVKMRLRDPAAGHLTILAIGMEAGFNSKSTFNSVFKKNVGLTPSQYRKKMRSYAEKIS